MEIIPILNKKQSFDKKIIFLETNNQNFKNKIKQLYLDEFKTFRYLMNLLNMGNRGIKALLIHYDIPIRYGSDAVKSQWVDNKDRKIKQSNLFKDILTGSTFKRTTIDEIKHKCSENNYKRIDSIKIDNTFHHNIECNNCKKQISIKGIRSLNSKCCITHKGKNISNNGEIKIAEYLIDNNIDFLSEVSFKDLYYRNKRCPLRFDFGLYKDNKLYCLIEYDGIQHFDINYSRDKKEWKHYKNRDILKNEYCIKNNIKLIRVPYFYYDCIAEYLDYRLNNLDN